MGKVDWLTAPDGAQFYSLNAFRKHEFGEEFYWSNLQGCWDMTVFTTIQWHRDQNDFEMKPDLEEVMSQNEIETYKTGLQNKPSWEKQPEWVNYIAQNKDGSWDCFEEQPKPLTNYGYWRADNGKSEYADICGDVTGDWRSTLEKRPDLATRNGEGLPPVGVVCELWWGGSYQEDVEIIQYRKNELQVVFWRMSSDHVDSAEIPTAELRPIRSDCERWCDEVRNKTGLHFDPGVLEAVFDEGFAKVPE